MPVDFARLVRLMGLGVSCKTLDADLNDPVPGELAGRFGLIVVDGGALEHIFTFDLRQGMRNTADMLSVGTAGSCARISSEQLRQPRSRTVFRRPFSTTTTSRRRFRRRSGHHDYSAARHDVGQALDLFQYDHSTIGGVNSLFCTGETQLAVYFTARKQAGSTSERVPMQSYFTRMSEGKAALHYQFVVSYGPVEAKIAPISDPEPGAGNVVAVHTHLHARVRRE